MGNLGKVRMKLCVVFLEARLFSLCALIVVGLMVLISTFLGEVVVRLQARSQ